MTSEFVVAVHAVVFLKHRNGFMTSEEIAENICTNPARIRKVLSKLKKAGLIRAREGAARGGYEFVGNPEETTMLTILSAIEQEAVTISWRSGNHDMDCMIASGMSQVMDGIQDQMNSSCNEVLGRISVTDVEKRLMEVK